MKNRLLTGLILSLLVASVSCKSSDSETTSENTSTATETKTLKISSPQEVLTKHLDAYFQGDFKTSYAYISDKDKTVKSLSEYRKKKKKTSTNLKPSRTRPQPTVSKAPRSKKIPQMQKYI